eukprot:921235-Amphidinium_carterae.1
MLAQGFEPSCSRSGCDTTTPCAHISGKVFCPSHCNKTGPPVQTLFHNIVGQPYTLGKIDALTGANGDRALETQTCYVHELREKKP